MTIPLMRNAFAHEAETRAALVEWRASGPARQPFYRSENHQALPRVDRVQACGFYFGIYPELTPDDMSILKTCLEGLS